MKPRQSETATLRRTALQARPYWPHILGIFLICLQSMPLILLTPLPPKIVIDSVIGSRPLPWVAWTGEDVKDFSLVLVYTDIRASNCFIEGAL